MVSDIVSPPLLRCHSKSGFKVWRLLKKPAHKLFMTASKCNKFTQR